jgi:DNA-binding NtrC family response regulator
VLFVDDEPSLLSALRRMLMPQRERWAMSFVDGGVSALELLERDAIDVVVSDMRMPGMDGSTLLREIQRLYPRVYRIVLSGYTEAEARSSVEHVAQRFLTKPCDPSDLISAIECGCSRRT